MVFVLCCCPFSIPHQSSALKGSAWWSRKAGETVPQLQKGQLRLCGVPGALCPRWLLWLRARGKGPCRGSSRPAEEPPAGSGGARDSEAPSAAAAGRGAVCLTRRFGHLFIFLGKSTVWPCMAPLPLTFSHLNNLLYLFSDLIRNYFYEACPLKPLYLLVNPAGGAAPLFERKCLTSPLFPHRVVNFMC